MTNIIKNLSLTVSLLGISIASYGADCNHLITLGSQKSVIPVAKNVSLSDVNSCLEKCTTDDCSNALSVLSYAVNYNDALSGLSPQQFSNASSSPSINNTSPPTQPVVQPVHDQAAATKSTPASTPDSGYIMTPSKNKNKKQQSKDTGIRWY